MTYHLTRHLAPALLGLSLCAGPLGAQEAPDGAYIATAADCAACHTDEGGAPFAGGHQIASPMGAITASNITPSVDYGIGAYTLEDFSRALRQGVRRDGAHLYPAMPYPAYAKMSDADIAALYDYFMNDVEAVDAEPAQTHLPFPFSQRWAMIGWNALFAGGDPLEDDPAQSQAWNRGRYLVEGPAHCGTCHTPRNLFMGSDTSEFLAGGMVGAWSAPNLTPGEGGLSEWSDADLKSYLKTGVAPHARASGPMAEAVEYSLQHLEDADIDAMVTYLRALPAQPSAITPAKDSGDQAQADTTPPAVVKPWEQAGGRDAHRLSPEAEGGALYETVCASCHALDGTGSADGTYPALVDNVTLEPSQSANLISTIVHGVSRKTGDHHTLMPGFGPQSAVQRLSDAQIARLATYTANSFGETGHTVSAKQVETIRTGGPVAPLVRLATPQIMIAAALAALLVVLLALWAIRRRLKR